MYTTVNIRNLFNKYVHYRILIVLWTIVYIRNLFNKYVHYRILIVQWTIVYIRNLLYRVIFKSRLFLFLLNWMKNLQYWKRNLPIYYLYCLTFDNSRSNKYYRSPLNSLNSVKIQHFSPFFRKIIFNILKLLFRTSCNKLEGLYLYEKILLNTIPVFKILNSSSMWCKTMVFKVWKFFGSRERLTILEIINFFIKFYLITN